VTLPGRRAIFIHSPELEKYSYPPDCPFKTERATQLRRLLFTMGLLSGDGIGEAAPMPADRKALKRFHTARYLHALRNAAKGRWEPSALYMGIGTQDCPIFPDMYDYAVLATGATLLGVERVLSGQADVTFNPSGGFHHAGPEMAAGFCYINDNAIACDVLAEAGKHVLYLDVDVHYGDGVAQAFYNRSDVMTISLHENPKTLFPGTGFEDEIGEGKGTGYCVNLPLPVGTYDKAYLFAFDSVVMPLTKAFDPDVIVLELGADTLAGDPLAHLHLTNNTFVEIINRVLRFGKPICATGGGGYHVENTVRAWALAWTALIGANDSLSMNPMMGGVMLESTDWIGGFRDRELAVSEEQRQTVLPALNASIEILKAKVFPFHGLL
jgi:acetoin utilization protein AcuC